MDVTGWLRAAPRPLVVAARDGRAARLAVERLARQRGWEFAAAPADADLLVVCGTPGVGLDAAIERVWSQVPAPRARADILSADGAGDELDRARDRIHDPEPEGVAGHGRAARPAEAGPDPAHEPAAPAHDMPAQDMPGHEMAADHGTAGGHDMHIMHGGDVAGLPMADRAPDRDGLTLDVLHVSLGPVLPDWPAGLALHVTLQGDVVQTAQVEVVGEPGPAWDGPPTAAALDSLARLLAVCGSSTAARTARRLRDDALLGIVDDAALRLFAHRMRRSRTLRWATDGLGRLDDVPAELAGDATARWLRWLDTAERGGPAPDASRTALEVLPGLVVGCELASVRVVVASLDPNLDVLVTPVAVPG